MRRSTLLATLLVTAWRLTAALAALLALTGSAAGQVTHRDRAESPYRIYRPAASGPFPVLILASGCSGFTVPGARPRGDRLGGPSPA